MNNEQWSYFRGPTRSLKRADQIGSIVATVSMGHGAEAELWGRLRYEAYNFSVTKC